MRNFSMGRRLSIVLLGVGVIVALVGVSSPADAATNYEVISQSPTQTLADATVVTSIVGADADYDAGSANDAYFDTNTNSGDNSQATVEWDFDRLVYNVTFYYANVESSASGGGEDPELLTSSAGAVDLSPYASGGNRVSSTGDLQSGEPEATGYNGNTLGCDPSDGTVCSGSVELSFPAGVTSFTAQGSALPSSGFNNVGLAVNVDSDAPLPTAPTITTTSLPDATTATAYSQTIGATGTAPITFTLTSGALPAGLILDGTTGEIHGTPTASGVSTFTITATNGAGSDDQGYTLTTNAAPTVTTQPANTSVVAGSTATFTVAATGSPTPTVQWQVSTNGGTSWTNVIGATNSSYTTGATVLADSGNEYRAILTNSVTAVASNAATLTVTPAPIAPTITTTTLSDPSAGTAYSSTVAFTGTAPATFAVTVGSLPAGLVLDPNTGVISGTPTTAGTVTFTVTVTNAGGTDSATFTVTTAAAALPSPTVPVLGYTGTNVTPALTAATLFLVSGLLMLLAGLWLRRRRAGRGFPII